jgi:hypothetical protein
LLPLYLWSGRCVNVQPMNKKLETLIERVPSWPQKAQQEAAQALATIEEKHVRRPLTSGERAKLTALRKTIDRAIARGGSYTDKEVAASVAKRLDAWERRRKGA